MPAPITEAQRVFRKHESYRNRRNWFGRWEKRLVAWMQLWTLALVASIICKSKWGPEWTIYDGIFLMQNVWVIMLMTLNMLRWKAESRRREMDVIMNKSGSTLS